LVAAAHGAVIQMEPRQADTPSGATGLRGGLTNLMLPKKKAFKFEEIKAKFPGAKRVKIIYGPYILKAANSPTRLGNGISMDKGGTSYQNLVDDDFPSDITVLETSSEIQDESFKRADPTAGIYNHHNVFMDLSKIPTPAYTCENVKPKSAIPMSVFMAGATERGSINYAATKGDIKTGYYLSKQRQIMNMIDVVNYNNVEKTVYTSSEIEYLPGKVPGYIDTVQQLIDPGTCGGPAGAAIHPPAGVQKFTVNGTSVVARDGYMLNIRGHLHDGGVNLFLKVNDKVICDSKAEYGGEGHTTKTADGKVWDTIRATSMCEDPIKVKKGDKMYMQANYDVGLHPSREQATGHGGMSMGAMKAVSDGGGDDAEQMALFITYFASL